MVVWINGSYATTKPYPGDVDLAIGASAREANALSPRDKNLLGWLVMHPEEMKLRFGCHAFFYPLENHDLMMYWRGVFGFDRHNTPKGIARLEVRP
nr:hypothetical protein [Deferrisoma camini]